MRVVAAVFCGLMVLFALVQYNDPDALYWGVIYGAAAIWCGLAAFRPAMISGRGRTLLLGFLAIAAFGVVWYWPKTPGFWTQEVWWVTETAREGMGMMIVFIALIIAWLTLRKSPQPA
ncbi:transmembrane 220 family protein [Phaeobacter marinintestinus]|uniref:transmembrane 220 family protein n=1 Tax=Falsiphaeobacter marinintestinus TaxID=1492905 RepID=UPI0011B4EF73|nr:transmembrane 220 family protein [Phaeobacter marinintestinus]